MSITRITANELKPGGSIMMDEEPCTVLNLSRSKPGKHGAAKIKVVARGIFDGTRRSRIFRSQDTVDVPIVDKKTAQVVNVTRDSVQLMDLQSYEMFEMVPPEEEELREKLAAGIEVEYWSIVGRRKVVRVLGG